MVLVDESHAGGLRFLHPCGQTVCGPGNAIGPFHARVLLSSGDAQKVHAHQCGRVNIIAQFLPVPLAHSRIRVGEICICHHAGDDHARVLCLFPQPAQIGAVKRGQMGHTDVGPVQAKRGGEAEPVGQCSLPSADCSVE